jgi:hypothetical protein
VTVQLLADHSLLLALPAFAPALVVTGVVIFIAVRDRRRRGEHADDTPDEPAEPG